MTTRVVTVDDVLDGHVGLDLECFDRIYLNGWAHNLQVSGQVVNFLTTIWGSRSRPRRLWKDRAAVPQNGHRVRRDRRRPGDPLRQERTQLDVMRPHLDRLVREGRTGVAPIGLAQEFQRVFTGSTYHPDADGGGLPRFGYHKADRRAPRTTSTWSTMHSGRRSSRSARTSRTRSNLAERARVRQARRRGGADRVHRAGQRGFTTSDDPAGLQRICESLGPGAIRVFCER